VKAKGRELMAKLKDAGIGKIRRHGDKARIMEWWNDEERKELGIADCGFKSKVSGESWLRGDLMDHKALFPGSKV
jgi:hypothetical protein